MKPIHFTALLVPCFLWASTASPENPDAPQPTRVSIETAKRGLPSASLEWLEDTFPSGKPNEFFAEGCTPVTFTGLAVAWLADNSEINPDEFHIEIRSRELSGAWTPWIHLHGYSKPEETPSGLYWSHLFITWDGKPHQEYQIRLVGPESIKLQYIKLSVADASSPLTQPWQERSVANSSRSSVPQPPIIPRSEWWGSLPAHMLNPTNYTPQQITITHGILHHSVTSNTPPDPAQVVRNIWDWHVNGNGWSDIGYNFLIDYWGNIYQGRYNPWLSQTDVRGAHAGVANSQSVGICLMGQFHPGASPTPGNPTSGALRGAESLLAWRFRQRSLDPLGSASISTAWGALTRPRISGHRDVSSTACPGDYLYAELPTIRANTKSSVTSITLDSESLPLQYALYQNFPNPFNANTTIQFEIPVQGFVSLRVYDLLGREMAVLLQEEMRVGKYSVRFDAGRLPTGVYLYALHCGDFHAGKKLVVMK